VKIEKVTFTNWCQYEKFELDLGQGFIGIRGPNGSGKSNLVEGLVYALTGKVRTDGNLEDNIRHGVTGRAKAGVEVELTHNDANIFIKRNLKPSGSWLTINSPGGSEEVLDRAAPIREKMQSIIGIDEDMLLKYVFVEQCKIFEFIDLTDEKRSKFLARLFNVESAEAIRKAVGDYKVDVSTTATDVDTLRATVLQMVEENRQLQEMLALYPSDGWQLASDPDHLVVLGWQEKQRLLADRNRLTDELLPLETAQAEAEGQAALSASDLRAVEELVTSEDSLLGQVRLDLARHEASVRSAQALEDIDRRLLEEKARRVKLLPPIQPADYLPNSDSRDTRGRLAGMQARMAEIKRFLTTFDCSSKSGSCPTCGTPTVSLADRVEEFKQEKNKLECEINQLRQRIEASSWHDTELLRYENDVKTSDLRVAELSRQRETLQSVELPGRSVGDLMALKTEYEQNQQALLDMRRSHSQIQLRLSSLQTSTRSLRKRIAEADGQLRQLPVTGQEAEEASRRLTSKREVYSKRAELLGRIEASSSYLRSNQRLLEKAEEEIRRGRKARALQSHFQNMRDLFHRDRLPRRVMQGNLELMQRGINAVLSSFDAPFYIQVREGLKCVAVFRDGKQMPAARLSVGEKTVFAMAFRLAVSERYAKDLGLLVLDEPTAGLDDSNLTCLEVALNRLRELSRSRGLQVILITHEKLLDTLFDRVIEIPSRR
jgi:DNA repair exonuclease SbcCD ATPase subunit